MPVYFLVIYANQIPSQLCQPIPWTAIKLVLTQQGEISSFTTFPGGWVGGWVGGVELEIQLTQPAVAGVWAELGNKVE